MRISKKWVAPLIIIGIFLLVLVSIYLSEFPGETLAKKLVGAIQDPASMLAICTAIYMFFTIALFLVTKEQNSMQLFPYFNLELNDSFLVNLINESPYPARNIGIKCEELSSKLFERKKKIFSKKIIYLSSNKTRFIEDLSKFLEKKGLIEVENLKEGYDELIITPKKGNIQLLFSLSFESLLGTRVGLIEFLYEIKIKDKKVKIIQLPTIN